MGKPKATDAQIREFWDWIDKAFSKIEMKPCGCTTVGNGQMIPCDQHDRLAELGLGGR